MKIVSRKVCQKVGENYKQRSFIVYTNITILKPRRNDGQGMQHFKLSGEVHTKLCQKI
jgi:hypothetical protein